MSNHQKLILLYELTPWFNRLKERKRKTREAVQSLIEVVKTKRGTELKKKNRKESW